MIDTGWIDELDGAAAADELARSRDRVIAAEAEQFCLAAHWADLHAPDFVDDCRAWLPGMSRPVAAGADGTPQIDEFAGAELAALLGRSTVAGEQLIADAVNVRHRHPRLWAELMEGRERVWLAVKVARRCVAAGLSQEQAHWVDAQTTPYLSSLPFKRFFDLLEARIIQVDPAAAEARAAAEALRRFVHAGTSDEHGMRVLVARAHAGDITYVVAVLDRIAAILGEQGDSRPVDVRRSVALRILANPARALALLTGATLAEVEREDGAAERQPVDDFDAHGWMRDAEGRPLPAVAAWCEGPGEPEPSDRSETVLDSALLRRLLTALDGFDATSLDPVAVLYLHLSETAVASGAGLARLEGVGPAALEQVRSWLADSGPPRITLRPVLDSGAVVPVDRYEHPAAMSELATVRSPFEVFPYGTWRAGPPTTTTSSPTSTRQAAGGSRRARPGSTTTPSWAASTTA